MLGYGKLGGNGQWRVGLEPGDDAAALCVEIGLDLKKRSPFPRTMVIGLANARHGYLPTPEQHKLGGYETWLGTNTVQEAASVIIVNNLLAMLAELAGQK